jgi:hypothetical protein
MMLCPEATNRKRDDVLAVFGVKDHGQLANTVKARFAWRPLVSKPKDEETDRCGAEEEQNRVKKSKPLQCADNEKAARRRWSLLKQQTEQCAPTARYLGETKPAEVSSTRTKETLKKLMLT